MTQIYFREFAPAISQSWQMIADSIFVPEKISKIAGTRKNSKNNNRGAIHNHNPRRTKLVERVCLGLVIKKNGFAETYNFPRRSRESSFPLRIIGLCETAIFCELTPGKLTLRVSFAWGYDYKSLRDNRVPAFPPTSLFTLHTSNDYNSSMLHIVLFNPEIPQNTGNVGRMCAITECRLHLIHPLGFTITDAHLRRAGMDYWKSLDIIHHENWDAFLAFPRGPKRLWLLTTKATKSLWDAEFCDEDGLVFGNEGHGAPQWLHDFVGREREIKIPQFNDKLRSLNLATSAGIATYEALRQIKRNINYKI